MADQERVDQLLKHYELVYVTMDPGKPNLNLDLDLNPNRNPSPYPTQLQL